jgi:hypothetical protein
VFCNPAGDLACLICWPIPIFRFYNLFAISPFKLAKGSGFLRQNGSLAFYGFLVSVGSLSGYEFLRLNGSLLDCGFLY